MLKIHVVFFYMEFPIPTSLKYSVLIGLNYISLAILTFIPRVTIT